ncbi:hypothetical protein DVU_3340 [Nitratidesulfovibrio vulgaris str. Hildenborough]|uniref:Uncharacterized protein n=1 Tax=Nitratidesulfovibrio vulgaris (strain ATCC 29579 / DSM 644 / CCUG 34227 / NCIMB 8303 / VKM B-1760 / Hildenborough) TaxID=882 RepID=Q725T4_NITV2|nr:hypothetical protein DVU_3340 [Nitratidesulfovibrio vulgaris str. Hildenborough]
MHVVLRVTSRRAFDVPLSNTMILKNLPSCYACAAYQNERLPLQNVTGAFRFLILLDQRGAPGRASVYSPPHDATLIFLVLFSSFRTA